MPAGHAAVRVMLLTAADAEAFLAGHQDAAAHTEVVTLSPAARGVLIAAGRKSRHGQSVFGTLGHAIAAVAARKAYEEIRNKMTAAQLPDHIVVPVSFLFFTWCAISVRLWRSLGAAERWLVPASGGLTTTADRREAHDHLMRAVLSIELRRWPSDLPLPAASSLFRSVRAGLLGIAGRLHDFIATPSFKMRFGLKGEVSSGPLAANVAAFRPSRRPWRDLAGVGLWLAQRRAGASLQVPLIPGGGGRPAVERLDGVLASIEHPVGRRVLAAVQNDLMTMARFVAYYGSDAEAPLRALKPMAAVLHEANELHGAVLSGGAKRAGVPVCNVNNNSLPRQSGALAGRVMQTIAECRISQRLTDQYLAWSPLTAGSVSAQPGPPQIVPIREAQPAWRPANGAFRILYASNSPDWYQFYPFIIETSDEFADALESFIAAMSEIEGYATTVRLRSKFELNPTMLAQVARNEEKVRITGVTSPFLDALAECDLLVSFMSSTIEQALQMRVPVLLWGPTRRHTHLPAQAVPPRSDKRSAVYVAHDAAHLREMLPQIRTVHHGRPLTEQEMRGLVWPVDTVLVTDALAAVLASSQPKPGVGVPITRHISSL